MQEENHRCCACMEELEEERIGCSLCGSCWGGVQATFQEYEDYLNNLSFVQKVARSIEVVARRAIRPFNPYV